MLEQRESMDSSGRVQGNQRLRVFNDLRTNKIPMRMYLLGRGYERLTIVTGMESKAGKIYLLVDTPNGFEADVPDSLGENVKLDFTDQNRIPHSCRTVIADVDGDDIWLLLPNHLNRSQRRRHFRIDPPHGTRMLFLFNGKEVEVPVINISMCGSLLLGPKKASSKALEFYKGAILSGIHLLANHDTQIITIKIKKAEIMRLEKNEMTNRTNFAIHYREIEPVDEKELEKFIYYCQRRLLKKRSLLMAE
jgi:hypothetical protein